MRTTLLYFALTSIAGLMFCSDESLAGTQEPEDKELQALLEARRDTLTEVVALIKARIEAGGKVSIFEQSRANTLLLEADLEAARTPQERIASFEKALKAQAGIEKLLKMKEEFAEGRRDELLMATAARMKTEIDLYKEKNGEWPASGDFGAETPDEEQRPDEDERPASREARRDMLQQAVRLIREKVEVGRAPSGDLANRNLLILAAELELATSQRDRIAIYEKVVENQKEIEQELSIKLEVGVSSRKELLNAAAARINAEIQLYQARKGQRPVVTEFGRENPAVAHETEDKELQTLLEARCDTLKKVVQLVEQQKTASVLDFTNANTKLLDAELELTKSQDERIAIFEKMLEAQTEFERGVMGMLQEGRVPKAEVLIATAARMKAEIDLHKARKKAK